MFYTEALLSTEKWMALIAFNLGFREILQTLYFHLLDERFATTLGTIDLTLASLEVACSTALVVLINDLFISALVFRAVVGLEILKFAISIALCVHSALSFDSAPKIWLALALLISPSLVGLLDCMYGYNTVFYPREPHLHQKQTDDTIIYLDSYEEGQGPLSQAYKYQKENRRKSGPQAEVQGNLISGSVNDASDPGLASFEPSSSRQGGHADTVETFRSNPNLPLNITSQIYPRFHPRTRTFEGGLLEPVIRSAIALALLELMMGIISILAVRKVHIHLFRGVLFPALASFECNLMLKLALIQPKAVYLLSPSYLLATVLRILSIPDCKNCNDIRTTPVIIILFESIKIFDFVVHFGLACVFLVSLLMTRKCACCGLSSCIRSQIALAPTPYSEWRRRTVPLN